MLVAAAIVVASVLYLSTSSERSAPAVVESPRAGARSDAPGDAPPGSAALDPSDTATTAATRIAADAPDDSSPAAHDAARNDDGDDSLRMVPIRSSVGVTMRDVERSADGVRYFPGNKKKVRLPRDGRTWFRAAGHLPAVFDGDVDEVVLEPELAFVLTAPGLRDAVRDAKVDALSWSNWQQRFASHGFVGDDTYVFAILPSYGASVFRDPVGLELRFHDHGALRLEPDLDARGVIRLDVSGQVTVASTALLSVRTDCIHGEARVTVECVDPDGAESRRRVDAGTWGVLDHLSGMRPLRVTRDAFREVEVGKVPADRAQLVRGRCDDGCLGSVNVERVVSNVPVVLDLVSAPVIAGRVVVAPGATDPDVVELEYELTDTMQRPVEPADWRGSVALSLAIEPTFLVVLGQRSGPPDYEDPHAPRYAHLRLRPNGYEALELTIDLHDDEARNLGDLHFTMREADLVVTGENRIGAFFLRQGGLELLLSEGSVVRIEDAATGDDGELLLFLHRDPSTEDALRRWRALPDAAALLGTTRSKSYALRRVAERTLEHTAMIRANCNVFVHTAPPDHGAFYLGYRWHGVDQVWGKSGHEDVGVGYTVQFTVPAGPLDVWWNTEPVAPDADQGGWGEFVDGRAELVIE